MTKCLTRSNDSSRGAKQRKQRTVDENHLVVCMVHDVGELFREESQVQGVQDTARTGRGEIQLEVTCRVPCERGDPTGIRDAQLIENGGYASSAVRPLTVGRALATRSGCGNDTLVREIPLGPMKDMGNGEWYVLHQSLHESRP